MVFETLHLCQIWTLYKTFAVLEADKYEQNKTGNTDRDYEHTNRKKQELPSESEID